MLKRNILCAIALFIGLSGVQAQKTNFSAPEYRKIEKTLRKKPENFNLLLERLHANDTTLSPSEYHLLYYGYKLQPDYATNHHKALSDSLEQLIQNKMPGETEFLQIVEAGDKLLQASPFALCFLDRIIYAHRMLGNNAMAKKLEFRFGRIVETIFNTGDGLKKETAFHVNSLSNATDMLRALGFGYARQQMSVGPQLHYLKVATNDFGIEGVYFYVPAFIK